ncbi:hypothetical protein QVD17_15433 [Tagetes erecta]|uniref:H/ACA ribonucleoprotein complex non-core subunit NAF1 n=1 Tax=Tagetes erecta TaxID=13708 RepID=A0AAD8NYM5_TARER|nr:hypothetical protein QVD17_15433 [Tagetes erecta]
MFGAVLLMHVPMNDNKRECNMNGPLEEMKESSVSVTEDSFLDSLLNFEDNPVSLMTEVEKPILKEEMNNLEAVSDIEIGEADPNSLMTEVEKPNTEEKTNNLEAVSDTEIGEADPNSSMTEVEKPNLEEETSSSEGVSDTEIVEASEDSSSDESDEEGFEMEQGEIREEVSAWCDDDDDHDDVPIRSMNEVQDLPPVPPVTVTIQPHHQTLPLGVVLSVMGCQVVVEGVEEHNPLSEGSILWVTESRKPLGVVDEIFGPVKNPYYIVRYNSEAEIPTGIQQGSLISFVSEFSDYALNNGELYKKGYDASGEHDEECSEELEFSDDEKEAEYKRMKKKGDKKGRTKKDNKSRKRGGNSQVNGGTQAFSHDYQPSGNSQVNGGPQAFSHNHQSSGNSQVNGGPQAFSHNQQPSGNSQVNGGPQAFSQAPNITPSGVWPYGFPYVQPQNICLPPNGFPSNVAPFMQPNFIQQPFVPQFNSAPGLQMFPPNFGAFASWPSGMPQNNLNQSQGGSQMVFQGLPQGMTMPARPEMENNSGSGSLRPAANGLNSNQGNGGRRPFQRGGGGGRFRGGRSGPRSR